MFCGARISGVVSAAVFSPASSQGVSGILEEGAETASERAASVRAGAALGLRPEGLLLPDRSRGVTHEWAADGCGVAAGAMSATSAATDGSVSAI